MHGSRAAKDEAPAVDVALAFVRAIETGEDPSRFLAPGAIEEELPNRIFPNGAERNVEAMRAGVERGKQLFRRQIYVVERALGNERFAALELEWKGELAVPLGKLSAGATMRTRAAFFFEIEAGLIVRIRHYDCFDPF